MDWQNPVPGVEPFNSNTLRVIFASLHDWSASGVGEPGYYGSFYDSTDQALVSATASQIVSIGSSYGYNGVSLVSGNRVVLDHAGVYTMTALFQVKNTDNAQHDCSFWLRLNGTDYANSAVFSSVPARKSATEPSWKPVSITFTGEAVNDGDYVEIYWHGSSTSLSLDSQTTGVSPTHPAAPSVVVSVTQVMSTMAGPQGPIGLSGPQGPAGANGPQGPMGGTYNIDGGDPSSVYGGILPLDAGGV
jgi:hypothetical protein